MTNYPPFLAVTRLFRRSFSANMAEPWPPGSKDFVSKTAAEPRIAPSGRPFHAHFVDVAEHAGLVAETIYGDAHHKD